jgi:hypothetical protein
MARYNQPRAIAKYVLEGIAYVVITFAAIGVLSAIGNSCAADAAPVPVAEAPAVQPEITVKVVDLAPGFHLIRTEYRGEVCYGILGVANMAKTAALDCLEPR